MFSGGGKDIRDGIGQSPTAKDAESLNLVITSTPILDAAWGVIEKDGGANYAPTLGIGRAGNPEIQEHITPDVMVSMADVVWNSAMPKIEVNSGIYTVKCDGRLLTYEPAKVLPMARRYFFS